jgi:hypothetical protein
MPDLDLRTSIRLGEALFRFLARVNAESELDEFTFEDTGVAISSGFIEMDADLRDSVSELLDDSDRAIATAHPSPETKGN